MKPALFAVWAVAMLSAAQAQSLIHFLPTALETQVETVTALANGEYFVNSTLGRIRLSSELTVRALNNDYVDHVVKSAVLGQDRIEISQSYLPHSFSGISTNFQFASPTERSCAVRRFNADESVHWFQRINGSGCTDISIAESGEIWSPSGIDVLTLRGDGTLKHRKVLPENERSFIIGVQAARGANLGGAFVLLAPHVPQFAAIAFIDASGVERWRVQTDALTPSLRALANGGVEIAGRSVQTFNASGQRLSERQDDAIVGSVVASFTNANTGERWVSTSASECALTKLSSTGTTLWRTPLPCTVTLDRIRNFNTADSQRAAVLVGQNAIAVVGKNAIADQPVGAPSQMGAWYNPATPGQGFFIERIGNTQFMAWFHNDWDLPDASVTDFLSPARQRWLTLQGDVLPGATQAQLKIYQTSGGNFTRESAGAPVEVGTATLTFLSCDSATLNYELAAQRCAGVACTADQRVGMLHGVIPLRALLSASTCAPTGLPAQVSAKTGLFHDPSVSGQGLITVVNANTLFAGWFTRDPADAADDPHKQAWFTLQATGSVSSNDSNAVIQAKIYRTLGGRRDSTLSVSSQELGEATLSFPSCDRVTMQYRFASGDSAKPFQNLAGQLNLVRIGACR